MDRRPALRVPPPVTAEGKPVEAAREKSFLEKYWVYIVVGLLALSASFSRVSIVSSLAPPLISLSLSPSRVHLISSHSVLAPAPAEEEGAGGRGGGSK